MEKIKNLSLRKTIILYMILSQLICFILSAFLVEAADTTQYYIWHRYIDQDAYVEAIHNENSNYEAVISRPERSVMSKMDWHISETCDFMQTYGGFFLAVIGSCIAVALFYKNKLKRPIEELEVASKMIAKDELEFHVTYENQDELGNLCKEFEKMRAQLEENNRIVWHTLEDEKTLRAAIAHDMRSPLSVLKGYQEMLLEFVPEETFDKEKIIEMLQEGMKQIERMNIFIETMRRMTRLEDRELHFAAVDAMALEKEIQKEAEIIGRNAGKICVVNTDIKRSVLRLDPEVILEVTENLLSNAVRYAKERIEILISSTEKELAITIQDDGSGFLDEPENVTKAFYHSNPQDDMQHFGMGMYISRIYCEKHGGRLLIGNQKNGGASVKAVFESR